MTQSQEANAASPPVSISLVGEGARIEPLLKTLTSRARHQGLELHVNSAASASCDVIWQLAGPARTDLPQAGTAHPAIINLVAGFGPPHHGAAHLPLLRLPHPGRNGSLAELMPPANGTDVLPDVFARSCLAMGYEPVVLAGASQGFAVRTANALMIEAMALLGEGVSPQVIETSATDAGLPEPPLLMLDLLGLKVLDDLLHAELHALSAGADHSHDHAHHHDHDHKHEHGHQHEDHGHTHGVSSELMPESAVYVLEKMAHGFDRMGASTGYGFYEHEEDGSAQLWDGLKVFARGAKEVPSRDIADRLLFRVALEARRCVHEGLLAGRDADLASHLAGVFAPVDGGISGWIAQQGEAVFAARANELAASYGKRFEVAA